MIGPKNFFNLYKTLKECQLKMKKNAKNHKKFHF